MNYVESLNLFGVEAKEIPCIKGSGAPTESTVGAVGLLYMDIDTGDIYKCTAEADGVYTWNNVGGNSDGDSGNAILYTTQNLTEKQKVQARENIGVYSHADNPDCHADYFTITDDGIVSLKPEYRGAIGSSLSSYSYAVSDNGINSMGSKNAELPKKLVIPEIVDGIAVVSLAPGMFLCNIAVENIVVPDTVISLPERFCDRASSLKMIYNTDNIETIGDNVFQGTPIEKAKFPNLKTMGYSAFNQCAYLTYVDIGNITDIQKQSFMMCASLSRIKGGEDVVSVGEKALTLTTRLNTVDFLDGLTSVGNYAFVRSRLIYDWDTLTNCTFGTHATAYQMNPTDIWSSCTVTPVKNSVPTLLSQKDIRWASRMIGTSTVKYSAGCVIFAVMHAYCALHNITLSTVDEFIEILESINPNLLAYMPSFSYAKNVLESLGLKTEYYTGWTQNNLQTLYDALADGKYAIPTFYGYGGSTHTPLIYGVNEKKELLIADSIYAPYQYHNDDLSDGYKYALSYQNAILPSSEWLIVSL